MKVFSIAVIATTALLASIADADQTTVKNYNTARGIFWRELYPDKQTGAPYSDLYCGFEFRSRDDVEMQVEHAFPANWFATELGCGSRKHCQQTNTRFNHIEADLHNLWPAAKPANALRSNHSFSIIPGETWEFEDCDMEKAESTVEGTPTKSVIEPRETARGNLARSLFYMAHEYNLPIEARLVPLLKEWNRADKVSRDEKRRNDLIEHLEGKRNRYIDDPALVDVEW
jgi:deoxyribonuclease-1